MAEQGGFVDVGPMRLQGDDLALRECAGQTTGCLLIVPESDYLGSYLGYDLKKICPLVPQPDDVGESGLLDRGPAFFFAVIGQPPLNPLYVLVPGNHHEQLRPQGRSLGKERLMPGMEMVEGAATKDAAPRWIRTH